MHVWRSSQLGRDLQPSVQGRLLWHCQVLVVQFFRLAQRRRFHNHLVHASRLPQTSRHWTSLLVGLRCQVDWPDWLFHHLCLWLPQKHWFDWIKDVHRNRIFQLWHCGLPVHSDLLAQQMCLLHAPDWSQHQLVHVGSVARNFLHSELRIRLHWLGQVAVLRLVGHQRSGGHHFHLLRGSNLPEAYCDGSRLLVGLRLQDHGPDWLLHLMLFRVSRHFWLVRS
jgi:hypothetical protein